MNSSSDIEAQSEFVFSSEEYYRIAIHLPVAKGREKLAAKATILKLQGQFDSYTCSSVDAPVFTGRWKNSTTGRVFRDLVSILTIDIAVIGDDPDADYSALVADAMWVAAESEYSRFKADQDSFWIAVSRVAIREKVFVTSPIDEDIDT